MQKKNEKGFSLVEVLVASAILMTIVVGVFGALRLFAQVSAQDAERTQAALLAGEAAEALQLLRDGGWTQNIASLSLDTPYYFAWQDGAYIATTTPLTIDGRFLRTITLEAVGRDGSDQIAESGTVDEGTRRVYVEVSRAVDGELLVDSDFLVHNIYEE